MGFNISRYRNRVQKGFEVEVVTPMFLGGAGVKEAELRTPSFKGMLRFWWRATCGDMILDKIKNKEANIFGSTTSKSLVSIHIAPKGKLFISKDLKERGATFWVHNRPVHILDYLAYGAHTYIKGKGNVYHKEHITPGNSLALQIDFEKKYEKEIETALAWLIHFGGLGARSRNGFGSMTSKIGKPKINCDSDLGTYSAMSNRTMLFTFSEKNTWHEAHSEIGLAYRTARLSIENSHNYARRKLVAAPITVNKQNVADLERHAKPYFLHVSKLNNGKYQGQILFMPYRYLAGRSDYDESKFGKYKKACEDMNNKLKELSGGAQ